MTIKSRFISGIYYGQDDFKTFIRDGLSSGYVRGYAGELQISATGNDMRVTVATGRGYIVGYNFEVMDAPGSLIVPASGSTTRYDRVVAHLDEDTGVTVIIKSGGANPPDLIREGKIYEISLARVRVRAGAGNIQQSDITDERGNPAVCGIVGPHAGTLPLASTSQVGGVQVDTSNGLTISPAGVLGYDGIARTIYITVGTGPETNTIVGAVRTGGARPADTSTHTISGRGEWTTKISKVDDLDYNLYSGLQIDGVSRIARVLRLAYASSTTTGRAIVRRNNTYGQTLAEVAGDRQAEIIVPIPDDWDYNNDYLHITQIADTVRYNTSVTLMADTVPRPVYWQYPAGTEVPVIQQPVSQIDIDQDELIAEIIDADNQAPAAGSYTAIGKLHARLIHAGKRNWPGDIPAEYQTETYVAYTNYYQYEPALEPVPNEQSKLPVD